VSGHIATVKAVGLADSRPSAAPPAHPRAAAHLRVDPNPARGVAGFITQQLGYASIHTTVDVYGHLILGESRAGIEWLAGATTRNPDATDAATATAGLRVMT
jgi:hypothetical protein